MGLNNEEPNTETESGTAQKMKFSIKAFSSKCDQILNRKLHFLCSVIKLYDCHLSRYQLFVFMIKLILNIKHFVLISIIIN